MPFTKEQTEFMDKWDAATGLVFYRDESMAWDDLVDFNLQSAESALSAAHELAEKETGIPLDFSDVPNILCETDKYLRVRNGEGTPRAKYVPGRGF